MFVRNLTDKDITLQLDGRPYLFPAPKVGEPIPVVLIGDETIGDHFIRRTYESPSKRDGRPAGAYRLGALQTKGLKEGKDYVIAAAWFSPDYVAQQPEQVTSIHTFPTKARTAPPEPSKEKQDLQRRERISQLDMGTLQAEAQKRGLVGKKDRPNKETIVDKLFASGYVAQNRF